MSYKNETNPIDSTPRIYVASLADYNAGILHGRWMAANRTAEKIHTDITAKLGLPL